MAAYPAKLDELASLLECLERTDRIEQLISTSERFRPVPERIATRPFAREHRVPACESEAYIWAEERPDETLDFHFAVENPQGISAMALAVVLGETLSGAPLEEVVEVPPDIIYRLFGTELSMGKSMGLMGMVSMVQMLAQRQLERRGDS